MKRCGRCGQLKDTDAFRWQPTVQRFHSWCRDCEREYARTRTNRSTRRRAARNDGRYFGVELELTGPDPQTILSALATAGINVRHVGAYRSTNGAQWELKRDGSVRGYGLELVSPKLRGDSGFEELRKVCFALQSVGATVDASTGLHVHVDFRGRDFAAVKRSILPLLENQDNIMRMMAPSRRGNHYCPTWSESMVRQLREAHSSTNLSNLSYYGNRGVVNCGSYGRHGSIEFRSHGGSTNFSKIEAWVKFLLTVTTVAETGVTAAVHYDSPADMLRAFGIDPTTSPLMRFERAAEQLEESEYADTSMMAV